MEYNPEDSKIITQYTIKQSGSLSTAIVLFFLFILTFIAILGYVNEVRDSINSVFDLLVVVQASCK